MAASAFEVPTVPQRDPAPRPAAEALCGPEIVLLGDAWEHVQLERDALVELARSGDLILVPQRLAALQSHLEFMRNRAVMVFGDDRRALDETVAEIVSISPRWSALALDDRRADLTREWPTLTRLVQAVGERFPDEALVSSSEASFILPPVVPSLEIHFDPAPQPQVGVAREIRFRLLGPGDVPVIPDILHTTHTEKLHALLLDPAGIDFHHEHPRPTDVPGEYSFEFTPAHPGPYRLWLDAMPVATGRGEFPIGDVGLLPRPISKIPAPDTAITEVETGGFRARLELPAGGLSFGTADTIAVVLEEPDGSPLTRLEPYMGAFAHVVGFGDDFQSILHIHPLGTMPVPGQTGGPRVDFQLRPQLPGWLRLYFQFQVESQVHLAAFVVPVTVK